MIQNLFRLGEGLLDVERPWSGSASCKEPLLLEVEQQDYCGGEDEEDYEKCFQCAGESEKCGLRGLT